ncbi:mediator of RNA polymerase II transcription subunit 1 [Phlebotomus papatasi]|uniref:mediator of RNA polymerase II transcription subunit 1 n=1 Tax=Phlebotomus papatasi TaxID=29031 RepID=UPI002483DD80|nr:mediator of RNA polymerase II transcription subunit 1 [Phlebotomus papatasi]
MSSKINGNPPLTMNSIGEKNKKWQLELLMERLRSKSSNKSFPELAKAVRMALLEKRYALDAVEKANLQKCLDSMQHCIKVTTRQGLVERLESLTRQLGLKFMEDTSGLFISSDMFYLEIVLDAGGAVQDVKVHHECKIEQQSCSELVNCLVNGDFADFTTQLEGLASIYQLNAEPKIKSKAFVALQALETDLYNLYKLQNFYKDPQALLLQSQVGIVQKRRGGHPMKLTYFVSPYELLDTESKTILPLTVEVIHGRNVGTSVTVNLEASAANKLQIQSILTVSPDGQPVYAPLATHNSTMLPASFVLTLNRKMPVTLSLVQQMTSVTEISFGPDPTASEPLLGLIAAQSADGELSGSSKGMFVTLPDQNHCYFLTEGESFRGIVIGSVPFTEPAHVPKLLKILRQQVLFNTLISSCIRANSRQDFDSTTVFEVSALSCQHLTVSLEHPFDEAMATVEFDLTDVMDIQCKVFAPGRSYENLGTILSRVVQKSLSIPVTMRALIKAWEQENSLQATRTFDAGNFNLALGPGDPGGRNSTTTDFTKTTDIKPSSSAARSLFSDPEPGPGEAEEAAGDEEGIQDEASEGFGEADLDAFGEEVAAEALGEGAGGAFQVVTASDGSGKSVKKRRVEEDFWKSPKSNVLGNVSDSGSNSDSNSLGAESADGGVTASSWHQPSDVEATSFNISPALDIDGASDAEIESDLGDGSKKVKKRSRDEANDKNVMPPFVSITPISTASSTNFSSVLAGIGLDRRPGIEIIPLGATQNLSSSITITPINTSSSSSPKEKKSSSSSKKSSSDDRKGEKKKKRKREDSPMGPPDALNKPVSVSIKGSDGAPLSPSGLMRKFSSSSSPKQSSPGGHHQSPKHGGLQSPKQYSSASPKHSSGTGSGKPSMSALKSATNSPSGKSSEKKSSSSSSGGGSSGSREKEKSEKKSSSSRSDSPKMKASSVKLKQIDLSSAFQLTGVDVDLQDLNKSSPPSQSKNRKGSLSAVIDKLKLAQNQTDEPKAGSGNGKEKSPPKSDGIPPTSSSYMVKPSLDGMKITINKTRNKESSPKTTESTGKLNLGSGSGGGSGSNSPKTHTGLKPGVNSGPASKKSQQNSSNLSGTSKSSSSSDSNRSSFQKSNSSGSLSGSSSKVSGNGSGGFTKTSSGSDLSKVSSTVNHGSSEKQRTEKSKAPQKNTFESVFLQANREADAMKKLGFGGSTMEGFMKALDKKFQIPKLSARSASTDEVKKESRPVSSSSAPTTPIPLMMASPTGSNSGSASFQGVTGGVTKMLAEYLTKEVPSKYPFSGSASAGSGSGTSPKYGGVFSSEISLGKSLSQDSLQFAAGGQNRESGGVRSNPSTPTSLVASPFPSPVAISRSSADSPAPRAAESDSSKSSLTKDSTNSPLAAMRPPSAPPTPIQATSGDSGALDFSTRAPPPPTKSSSTVSTFPPSPSVSLHIVKSPVPSPLVIPSPHSGSPCITDDELMDEALVGISGK